MDQTILYLKQNSKTKPSKELMLSVTSVEGVPYVYATAKDYDMPFCETEYANEWMHVSYVIDYLEGYVTEFTIDDNTFTTDELITQDADDTKKVYDYVSIDDYSIAELQNMIYGDKA